MRPLLLATLLTLGLSLSAAGAELTGHAEAIDGDSLCLGHVIRHRCEAHRTLVRLAGVDAFEGRQACEGPGGETWPCGERAARALAAILRRGSVACIPTGRSYDRVVATCRDGKGQDVGAQLVRDGLALNEPRYLPDYASVEADARRRRAGVWAGRFVPPWEWRHAERDAAGGHGG